MIYNTQYNKRDFCAFIQSNTIVKVVTVIVYIFINDCLNSINFESYNQFY